MHYKILRYVHVYVTDALSMSVTGKIRDVEMREQAMEFFGECLISKMFRQRCSVRRSVRMSNTLWLPRPSAVCLRMITVGCPILFTYPTDVKTGVGRDQLLINAMVQPDRRRIYELNGKRKQFLLPKADRYNTSCEGYCVR